MKSKTQKRQEAKARAQKYTYKNSRAKRLGTQTEEQWEKSRTVLVNRL